MKKFNKPIIVTGAAGFIGSKLVEKLLNNGEEIIGIDNINNYYDPNLKNARLKNIEKQAIKGSNWNFEKISITDYLSLNKVFIKYKPRLVINLAAQAGVRYSMENPSAYFNTNLVGFGNILECCRNNDVEHLIYASSSSVYGGNKKLPFEEEQSVNHPVSLYAATKKSNELMAHAYSHLYNIPSTGLRFFTVYGPWGRPDMAPMIFAKSILKNEPIKIFNYGNMQRDFTYIDDIAEGIFRCCYKVATVDEKFEKLNPKASTSFAPHRIFNIGNSSPIELKEFIELLEDALGIKAIKDFKPMQPGDVENTAADTTKLFDWVDFKPLITLEEGIVKFAKWYKDYYY